MMRVKFKRKRVDPNLSENNASPTFESCPTKTTNRVVVNNYFNQINKKKTGFRSAGFEMVGRRLS